MQTIAAIPSWTYLVYAGFRQCIYLTSVFYLLKTTLCFIIIFCATTSTVASRERSVAAKPLPTIVILKTEIPSLDVPKVLQGAIQQSQKLADIEPTADKTERGKHLTADLAKISDKDKLLIVADQLIKSGKIDDAEACLERATSFDPYFGQAFARLARVQVRLGKQNAAIANLWVARELGVSTTEDGRLLVALQARLLSQCAKIGMRYHDYNEFTDRGDVRSLLNQGVRFYSIGDYRIAWKLFAEAAKQAPANPDSYYNLGALCDSAGLTDEAKKFFKLACKLDKTDFQSRLALGTAGEGQFTIRASADKTQGLSVCPLCRIEKGIQMHGD